VTVGQLIRHAGRMAQPDIAVRPHTPTLIALISLAAGTETLTDQDISAAVIHAQDFPAPAELDALAGQLVGEAFIRSGCELADGESLWQSRRRGQVAEALEDALRAVRTADMATARRLIDEALAGFGTE
jgi:hypothetical protein